MVTLNVDGQQVKIISWSFPGGERGIRFEDVDRVENGEKFAEITCKFMSNDDLIDLMLLADALKRVNPTIELRLVIRYFPYARQDRAMVSGESFSLGVIASMINSIGFSQLYVFDPHSDVLPALFPPGKLVVVPQSRIMHQLIPWNSLESPILVSPDAGAQKKIYALSKILELPVVTCNKTRDVKTGDITGIEIPDIPEHIKTLVVIDDICDGGKTFIELAKAVTIKYPNRKFIKVLAVTHGIFSKGLDVIREHYDQVYFRNNLMKD